MQGSQIALNLIKNSKAPSDLEGDIVSCGETLMHLIGYSAIFMDDPEQFIKDVYRTSEKGSLAIMAYMQTTLKEETNA